MAPLEAPIGVGALVDAIMFGCVIVQSCVYYRNARAGAWLLRLLVSLILFLLLSHLGCMAAWLWANNQAETGDHDDAFVADYATILFGVSNIFGATISFFVRCFFSHRILKISNNPMLACMFFIFCIFSFTAALGAASAFCTTTTADLTRQLSSSWIFPLVIISGLVCDLALSITTAFYLKFQTPTEVEDDLRRVPRLLLLVTETGSVMSLFDVAAVLTYWMTKSNLAWVGLLVSTPGVFANLFLAALNVRGYLCPEIEHQRVKVGESFVVNREKRPPIMVDVTITKEVDTRLEDSPV